ncbi:hypothetical protein WJX74_007257 [Apatococcus lobatus]|uniref:Peroxin-5 n=1 Tax=Apatococcus lobatus TaxID=904363 RepID=A0AAW1S761_9CHLO
MALRGLVTGSDNCTPADGAGPSNALGSLADSLLGGASKQQERLRELPSLQQNGAGLSWAGAPLQAPSIDAAVRAVSEGGRSGMEGSTALNDQRMQFLRQVSPELADFEEIYAQQGRPGTAPGPPHLPWQEAWRDEQQGSEPLQPFLRAFLDSSKAQGPFPALPQPRVQLTVEDQCRIRDRSTIMARQLYAERGEGFADGQVGRLLESLNIDPRHLPAHAHPHSWDALFQQGSRQGLGQPPLSHEVAAGGRMAAAQRPGDLKNGWAEDFARLQLRDGPPNQWAAEFDQRQAANGGWAQEFQSSRPDAWAHEFGSAQDSQLKEVWDEQQGKRTSASALADTKRLAETLAGSNDPKMKNSKFLQFVSKMSRGEIILEGNQAKEVPASVMGNQWAEDFVAARPSDQAKVKDWTDDFAARWAEDADALADEFTSEMGNDPAAAAWVNQFAEQEGGNELDSKMDEWIEQFSQQTSEELQEQQQRRQAMSSRAGLPTSQDYIMAEDNPFLEDTNSFSKGRELFRDGLLTEAMLAFEAEAQRNPSNVEAWRMLGTVQAENDDDLQAIAALGRALQADPNNPEVLLSLGVSHTNELDQAQALSYLHTWMTTHKQHSQAAATVPVPGDSSQRLSYVIREFEAAAAKAPQDSDLHVALGVLNNLARSYDRAVESFRRALQLRSGDYSLWNKLGATLANSTRSSEAISAYQRALELKPNYMRAWVNMGISQANVGEYELSARYYVRALSLNARSSNVWGYLRTSLSCSGRLDLIPSVDDEDLRRMQQQLPL